MEVEAIKKKKGRPPEPKVTPDGVTVPYLLSLPFFLIVCALSKSTAKVSGVILMIALLGAVLLCWEKLKTRVTLPLIALTVYVLIDGISTQYAIAGKFALREFLKVISAFSLTVILLTAAPGERRRSARWIASLLESASAIAAVVSIDLLSTHVLSGAVLRVLSLFTSDYTMLSGVEAGVRMTSVYDNPNIFAGCIGIGVLFSLGLALSSDQRGERTAHIIMLYINSLAFVLAFSMGATIAVIVAFIIFLVFERKEWRPAALVLMIAVLAVTLVAAVIISKTSFQEWSGFDPVPMLCMVLGAAALVFLDRLVLQKIADLPLFSGKAVSFTVAGILCLLVVYAVAAWNITGPFTLEAGSTLRRAAYPEAGVYELHTESDRPLSVLIESQNQQETMMHTSTVLYSGDAQGAVFEVPEGALAVYYSFSSQEQTDLQNATYAGSRGGGKIPLDYLLLPGFISNRLQGLLANENAIQRFVFFSDGMKLFCRNPVFGLGIGGFESAVKSVQSFYYETKYVHNQYIQALLETGIIGLICFVGALIVSGAYLWRSLKRRNRSLLLPALAAALVFIAVHGAVEVVFSSFSYLPFAYAIPALIGLDCEDDPLPSVPVRTASLISTCVISAAFAAMVVGNISANRLVANTLTFQSLEQAAKLDRFEWADYLLTYVDQSTGDAADDVVRENAEKYAARLAETASNSAPIILAVYYFRTGDDPQAFAMLEKYVGYVASDERAWNAAFHLLAQCDDGSTSYEAEAGKLYGMMTQWNETNIGTVSLDEASRAYLERNL